jgi:hypothetical protein
MNEVQTRRAAVTGLAVGDGGSHAGWRYAPEKELGAELEPEPEPESDGAPPMFGQLAGSWPRPGAGVGLVPVSGGVVVDPSLEDDPSLELLV